MNNDNSWILTYTGCQFWPFNPRAEDVCIEDIAHALSCLCRFGGHVREFYSVAQHSVITSCVVHSRYALEALLHDASEAYLVDVPRPIKRHDGMAVYRAAERRLEQVISQQFNLRIDEPGAVREADARLLLTERRALMAPGHWLIDESQCVDIEIVPMAPKEAERAFLERFKEITS